MNYLKYFDMSDFTCKCGCGENLITENLLKTLHNFRVFLDSPLNVTSGYRCKKHNDSLPNSSPTSKHLKGKAVDLVPLRMSVDELKEKALIVWNENNEILPGGLGLYSWGIHIDVGSKRKWGS